MAGAKFRWKARVLWFSLLSLSIFIKGSVGWRERKRERFRFEIGGRERERAKNMMLPGVELARKRRVHFHSGAESSPVDPTAMRLPVLRPTAMDESALAARTRLEEKLRRLAGPPPPAAAASSSSSPSFSPRWRQHVDNGRETSRRQRKASNKGGELKRTVSRTELCAVCLDDFQSKQGVMKLPCSHKYHSDCLLPWLASHSDCPCCRRLVPSMNGLS